MLSVGEMLKSERERRGLTLQQAEKEIRIRQKFLAQIEQNDWSGFASKIYISGIIRNYSQFLGLDPEKMLAFFRRDYERIEELSFKKKMSTSYLTPQTKKFAVGGIVSLCLLFVLYFGYQLNLYLSPPTIIIEHTKTSFRSVDRVRVTGHTDRDAIITIFGERVYQDRNGEFSYDFPLKKGKNTLTIDVTGANGRKTTVKKTFTLD